MDIDLAHLPTDTVALQTLVHVLAGEVKAKSLKIAQLEARIAKLKRLQFGQSSEKLAREIEQLELELDELHEDEGVRAVERPAAVQALIEKPARRPLPPHLPRQEEVHEPSCACPNCGGQMRRLGEDVTEVLEYVPASFKVIRHVAADALLPGVRDDCAGADAVAAHREGPSGTRPSRPCSGGQIRRPSAALPAIRHLCPRRCGTGTVNARRLGGPVGGPARSPGGNTAQGHHGLGRSPW